MISPLPLLALRLCAAFGCAWLAHRGSAQVNYSVTDLGALGTGTLSQALGINNAGQIVGLSYTSGVTLPHATLYHNGALTDLGLLPNGGTTSSAHAINDAGVIVGLGHVPSGNTTVTHGFSRTTNGGVFTDLGTLGNGTQSDARGIASNGVIVGQVTLNGVGEGRAFSYSNGVMTNIGDPSTSGGLTSNANGVNVVGGVTTIVGYTDRIVGSGEGAYTVIEAFTYTAGGGLVNLGSLGNGAMGTISKANAISSTGLVVGESSLNSDNSVQHAFRYTLGGTMTDLGTLGGDNSYALAVNSSGLIVGDAELVPGDSTHHAFSFMSGGSMTDLNTLIPGNSGWTLIGATGVNDSGLIVGYGAFNGAIHGYLLTAIPEPANWAAVFGFLAMLGAGYHRRQRLAEAKISPGRRAPPTKRATECLERVEHAVHGLTEPRDRAAARPARPAGAVAGHARDVVENRAQARAGCLTLAPIDPEPTLPSCPTRRVLRPPVSTSDWSRSNGGTCLSCSSRWSGCSAACRRTLGPKY